MRARFGLRAIWSALALLFTVVAVPSVAQDLTGVVEDSANQPAPVDPFARDTPRSTITGLLSALGAEDYTRAGHYFVGVDDGPAAAATAQPNEAVSTKEQEAAALRTQEAAAALEKGAELARQLKRALDAGGSLISFGQLSNAPTGRVDDGRPADVEEVGSFGPRLNGVPVLLQQVVGAGGGIQWRVAPETVEALERWTPVESMEPTPETSSRVAGAPVRDWLVLIGIALGVFLLLRLIAAAIVGVLRRSFSSPDDHPAYRFAHAALPPLALYLSVVTFYFVVNGLELAIVARQTLLRFAGIVAWVALAWFLLRLVDAVARVATDRMHRAERRQAVSIITFLRRGAKLLFLAIAAIPILDRVGLDVTTGLAALGIGGLALALGAQKTIENLVGSVTLIVDKPVQVGDSAQIGDVFGTVEDIGMRSTLVRTMERTVVCIPNGNLAAERIENFSLRDRFLLHQTLGVSYDTDATTMQQVLKELRTIFRNDEAVLDEEARVRFLGFGDSALKIELFAYFRTRSYPESLAMQESLLLRIMTKLDELDVDVAFPTRTVHLVHPLQTRDGT